MAPGGSVMKFYVIVYDKDLSILEFSQLFPC